MLPLTPSEAADRLLVESIARQALAAQYGCRAEDLEPSGAVRAAGEFEQRPLEWIWPGKIPRGLLTVVAGDPGAGASLAVTDLAARVSSGNRLPGEPGFDLAPPYPPADVLFVAPEDEVSRLIRPRLDKLRANLDHVQVLSTVEPYRIPNLPSAARNYSLATDLPLLEKALAQAPDVKLVVVDPLRSLSAGIGLADVRGWQQAFDGLARIAARFNVAIIVVVTLSRRGTRKAIHRLPGGPALAAAAGAVWFVTEERERPIRRRLVPALMRFAPLPRGIAFDIVHDQPYWAAPPLAMTADEALADEAAAPAPAPDRDTAMDWLANTLSDGPLPYRVVQANARRNGIAERTLKRAKLALEIQTRRKGFGKGSSIYWSLCGDDGDWLEPPFSGEAQPSAAAAESQRGRGAEGQRDRRAEGQKDSAPVSKRDEIEESNGHRTTNCAPEAQRIREMNVEHPTSNIERRSHGSDNRELEHANATPPFDAVPTSPVDSGGTSFDVGCSTFDVRSSRGTIPKGSALSLACNHHATRPDDDEDDYQEDPHRYDVPGRDGRIVSIPLSGVPDDSFDVGRSMFDVRRSSSEQSDASESTVDRSTSPFEPAANGQSTPKVTPNAQSARPENVEHPTSNFEHRSDEMADGVANCDSDSRADHTGPTALHTGPTPPGDENPSKASVSSIPGHPRAEGGGGV